MPTVLITGVNRGIGLELLKQYADADWQVIGTCRDLAQAREAGALAERENVSLHVLEITNSAAVEALAERLRDTPIDVLLLNAGVMGKASMTLGQLEADDFRRVLDVNVVAPAICIQAFRKHVAASERRIIVGMGSFMGSIASNNDGGGYSYRSSKSAIHAIMRSVSIDLREEDVTAIALHPGWVQTDMGGENATITTAQSVAGIMRVIDGLGLKDSGRLLTYAGEELPW